MQKKAIFLFIALSLTLVLSLNLISAASYYGGYLGGDSGEEYTTYHITTISPDDYYDKAYTKTKTQDWRGETTKKTYIIQKEQSGAYPEKSIKTYTTIKRTGGAYSNSGGSDNWGFLDTNSDAYRTYLDNKNRYYEDLYYPSTSSGSQCSDWSWRCKEPYLDNPSRYSDDYRKNYYYTPYYDTSQGYYVWSW